MAFGLFWTLSGFLFLIARGADTYFGEKASQDQCDEDDCSEMTQDPDEIHVIITFTFAKRNVNLQNKFRKTVTSLLEHATVPLEIQVIGDNESQAVASDIIREASEKSRTTYKVRAHLTLALHSSLEISTCTCTKIQMVFSFQLGALDVDILAKQLDEIVKPMQKHFSYKPGANYHHALFFLSIAMHKVNFVNKGENCRGQAISYTLSQLFFYFLMQVMPERMHKVIMLDADLKFRTDIKELYQRFRLFADDNIIGIGRELQPVYKHTFYQYRNQNPGLFCTSCAIKNKRKLNNDCFNTLSEQGRLSASKPRA